MQEKCSSAYCALYKIFAGKKGSRTMEWPRYAPDLHPIEYPWKWLKENCFQKYPNIKDLPERLQVVKIKASRSTARSFLGSIGSGSPRNPVESMAQRVADVLAAKG